MTQPTNRYNNAIKVIRGDVTTKSQALFQSLNSINEIGAREQQEADMLRAIWEDRRAAVALIQTGVHDTAASA